MPAITGGIAALGIGAKALLGGTAAKTGTAVAAGGAAVGFTKGMVEEGSAWREVGRTVQHETLGAPIGGLVRGAALSAAPGVSVPRQGQAAPEGPGVRGGGFGRQQPVSGDTVFGAYNLRRG